MPTLILIGDNASARSNHLAQAESLKNRIAGAELQLLKGQSNGFFWQAPEESNQAVLHWIRKNELPRNKLRGIETHALRMELSGGWRRKAPIPTDWNDGYR